MARTLVVCTLQYYSESRKVHDAQMKQEPDAAEAAGTPAQAAAKLQAQNKQAAVALTPIRQTS